MSMEDDFKIGGEYIKQLKDISEIFARWVTIGAIIIGGFWAVNQYWAHERETSIARTLEYVQRYNTGEIAKHRWILESKWHEEWESIRKILTDQYDEANMFDEEFTEKVKTVVAEDLESFLKVEAFLKEVTICTSSGICNRDETLNFFGNEGSLFVKKYYPIICHMRDEFSDRSFGENIIKLFHEIPDEQLCGFKT